MGLKSQAYFEDNHFEEKTSVILTLFQGFLKISASGFNGLIF